MRCIFRPLAIAAAIVCLTASAQAEVRPHHLFSDHAVLQQGMPVNVFGFADGDEKVTVSLQGQEASTKSADGRWQVTLDKLEAGGPFELTIAGENNKVVVNDVLVGEVWVCSGQSNMQWAISQSSDAEANIAASENASIRLITVPRRAAAEPESDIEAVWELCGPATTPGFSAVAYHFGRDLQQRLGVPVGLISSNYGGTVAEAWTSRESLHANPAFQYFLTNPVDPANPNSPTGLYNAMIHPLLPASIRGAIWYQGESNAGRAYEYRTLFPAMIEDWRQAFKQPEMPFFFVQLAPWRAIVAEPGESDWAELREAQLLTSINLPHTGQAVITDLGDEADIHPPQKGPVGERLARAARALVYGEDVEYSGPLYDKLTVSGEKAILSFTHLGGGLVARDGALKGFTVCGADRKFYNAEAQIDGDTVVVSSPQVAEPVAVRYGWANYPVVNLFNQAELPASPFRTDDFPITTGPKE